MDNKAVQILIINQHGENRGDEAAMRAMLSSLQEQIGDVRFVVIYQFRDRSLRLSFEQEVTMLPMIMPAHEAFFLFCYSLCRACGIKLPFLLTRLTKQIITAYEQAHIVISAPGGPYFGDTYAWHELAHWFLVWLGRIFKKPLMLYAPSCGPFKRLWLNIFRRKGFALFDLICLRESISEGYLRELCGEQLAISVTADSALQREIGPLQREQYFGNERPALARRFLVIVSALDYQFPGEVDVAAKKKEYLSVLLFMLQYLASKRECHFLFLPQLYGKVHSDVPFLESVTALLPPDLSWEIVDREQDSDFQQGLIAMSDFCIASRYHPQIFAGAAGVPGICIYYEHKARGFMEALAKSEFAFDIRKLEREKLLRTVDRVLDQHLQIKTEMKDRVPLLRNMARETTRAAIKLLVAREPKLLISSAKASRGVDNIQVGSAG